MYSQRLRNKIREFKKVPEWVMYTCWIANNRLMKTDKFIGD